MNTWHGWSCNGRAFYIGRVPGRKSVCLYEISGPVLTVLAFFKTEDLARQAMAVIDKVIGPK